MSIRNQIFLYNPLLQTTITLNSKEGIDLVARLLAIYKTVTNESLLSSRSSNSIQVSIPRQPISTNRTNQQSMIYISADYDNCFSILFKNTKQFYKIWNQLDQFYTKYKMLRTYLDTLIKPYDKVRLFCGSARQSKFDDIMIQQDHQQTMIKTANKQGLIVSLDKVGFCHYDYESWCKQYQPKWELIKLLLADIDNKVSTGTSWKSTKYRLSKKHSRNVKSLKIDMIRAQIQWIIQNTPPSHYHYPVDFYFFDDWKLVIQSVSESYYRKQLQLPSWIQFHLVQYNQNDNILSSII